jgi:hypothetical protein
MFRIMFHNVFGYSTYSKYYTPERGRHRREIDPDRTGAAPLPKEWPDAYKIFTADSKTTYLVKTHDAPEDTGKTIYVVRHGLAVIRSYKHYLHDFNKLEYSLEQVILGEARSGSWGRHLDVWNPLERPNTLLVKYEDLVDRPDEQLERIAEFTSFARKTEWVNDFRALHAANPKMYREGPKVPPEEGFTQEQQQLFWALHGDWMARLGYGEPRPASQRALRAVLADRLQALGAGDPKRTESATPKRGFDLLKLGKSRKATR